MQLPTWLGGSTTVTPSVLQLRPQLPPPPPLPPVDRRPCWEPGRLAGCSSAGALDLRFFLLPMGGVARALGALGESVANAACKLEALRPVGCSNSSLKVMLKAAQCMHCPELASAWSSMLAGRLESPASPPCRSSIRECLVEMQQSTARSLGASAPRSGTPARPARREVVRCRAVQFRPCIDIHKVGTSKRRCQTIPAACGGGAPPTCRRSLCPDAAGCPTLLHSSWFQGQVKQIVGSTLQDLERCAVHELSLPLSRRPPSLPCFRCRRRLALPAMQRRGGGAEDQLRVGSPLRLVSGGRGGEGRGSPMLHGSSVLSASAPVID